MGTGREKRGESDVAEPVKSVSNFDGHISLTVEAIRVALAKIKKDHIGCAVNRPWGGATTL